MKDETVKRIHISLEPAFLEIVEQAAEASYMTRSQYIRLALLEKLGHYNLDGSKVRDKDEDPDEQWQKLIDGLYGR